ncbi:39S ribosomal protein L13, mitochondrial-like, partial [Diaphorina citri]|uniref:39S ribosomal protein L13, mitochondrial-like n=1 Tax=Diaphorina citri TaxID=121845 RepID=A0A3Q0IZJ8_DIACI
YCTLYVSDDCGDHVIVMNSRHIALPGYEWKKRAYFHHTGYPGGVSWTLAWQLHEIDPTLVMKKAVRWELPRSLIKFRLMARLHIFPDQEVPEDLLKNVSSQIRQLRPVPRTLASYSDKEVDEFPKINDFPKDYILK